MVSWQKTGAENTDVPGRTDRLRGDVPSFDALVGFAGREVLEFIGPSARPVDHRAVDAVALADAERDRQPTARGSSIRSSPCATATSRRGKIRTVAPIASRFDFVPTRWNLRLRCPAS